MIGLNLDVASLRPQAIDGPNGPSRPRAPAGQPSDFASYLGDGIRSVSEALRSAEATAGAGMRGEVPLQQVVEHVMQAERQLQVALALRDKIVQAYLEISKTPI